MSSSPPSIVRPSIPPQRFPWILFLIALGLILVVVLLGVWWFVIRVEVNANEILVLVNKSGRALPSDLSDTYNDQVVLYPELLEELARRREKKVEDIRDAFKGIRYEPLAEGRYFYNPYTWKRIPMKATIIRQSEMGVLVRKFGEPLPFPKTVATEPDERGPVAEILKPGRHNINLLAYDVLRFDAIQIPPGHVGVVTLLSGKDPKVKNTYTVEPGEKGVQKETLPPGLEFYNPYLQRIEIVDIRSKKYDMLDQDAIHFPSNDSFDITIEGTIEWAIRSDKVAEVTVAYGDEQDILDKIILPNARSISRVQGSKLKASEFISGDTRAEFQNNFYDELRRECGQQGIEIKAALVREIIPPPAIAGPISEREQADQEIERYTYEMAEAKAQVELVKEQELLTQNAALGDKTKEVVTLTQRAEEKKVVAVTQANRELEVARLRLEAAAKEAAAMKSRGKAEANVILFDYEAKAEPLAMAVNAFGDGETYAQMFFLEKVAPSIQSILSNTEGPFAEIFKQFQAFPAASPPVPQAPKGGDQ